MRKPIPAVWALMSIVALGAGAAGCSPAPGGNGSSNTNTNGGGNDNGGMNGGNGNDSGGQNANQNDNADGDPGNGNANDGAGNTNTNANSNTNANTNSNTNANANTNGNVNDNSDDPDIDVDDDDVIDTVGCPTQPGPAGFPDACQLTLGGEVVVEGAVEEASMVEVYALQPLAVGDRIDVRCEAPPGSELDPAAALFDASGYRLFWNDDADLKSGDFDAAFEGVIPYSSSDYYLAVASTTVFDTSGRFLCRIIVQPQVGVAAFSGQPVVLQWAAATNVVVSSVQFGTLQEFDAGDVDGQFANSTAQLKARIETQVVEDFSVFNVDIRTTDDPQPAGGFSTVYFAASSSQPIFGFSDGVDFYNQVGTDNAVVFMAAFAGLTNSVDALGQAMANAISHEIGHTLGLMTTTGGTTLMSAPTSGQNLLDNRVFGVGDLVDFPVGQQSAPLVLQHTVGLAARIKGASAEPRCGTCGMPWSHVVAPDPSAP